MTPDSLAHPVTFKRLDSWHNDLCVVFHKYDKMHYCVECAIFLSLLIDMIINYSCFFCFIITADYHSGGEDVTVVTTAPPPQPQPIIVTNNTTMMSPQQQQQPMQPMQQQQQPPPAYNEQPPGAVQEQKM